MAELRKARAAVQRAYSKLINRFGPDSEVLAALTEALSYMGDSGSSAEPTPPQAGASTDAPASQPVSDSETEQKADDPGSKPKGRAKKVTRGNR